MCSRRWGHRSFRSFRRLREDTGRGLDILLRLSALRGRWGLGGLRATRGNRSLGSTRCGMNVGATSTCLTLVYLRIQGLARRPNNTWWAIDSGSVTGTGSLSRGRARGWRGRRREGLRVRRLRCHPET